MDNKDVIELIKKYQHNKYMTNAKFAEMCGISERTLVNIKNGSALPGPKLLKCLGLEQLENKYRKIK